MSAAERLPLNIVAYCCRYCAYAAADLAGVLRLQYPAELRIVELPCTGRIDMLEVLCVIERGADGVMVAGCLEGDCHFRAGNLNARRRVERIQELLRRIGLEPDRVQMVNMSSAMGRQFAEAATHIAESIRGLGPSPLRAVSAEGIATGPWDSIPDEGHISGSAGATQGVST
jgi:coenzyme F420-reducing hydrogenase delta subunit